MMVQGEDLPGVLRQLISWALWRAGKTCAWEPG